MELSARPVEPHCWLRVQSPMCTNEGLTQTTSIIFYVLQIQPQLFQEGSKDHLISRSSGASLSGFRFPGSGGWEQQPREQLSRYVYDSIRDGGRERSVSQELKAWKTLHCGELQKEGCWSTFSLSSANRHVFIEWASVYERNYLMAGAF